jgi:Sulfotransferase family
VRTASLYAGTAARVMTRRGRPLLGRRSRSERLIFVTGSPRSGTTFFAGALGDVRGVVDLGEVKPLKAEIPQLVVLPEREAAVRFRRVVERVRTLARVTHLRSVEQTPETAFVLRAALAAYPEARAVHVLRDGRDVACSLLERGWLAERGAGRDDVRQPFGAHARFWVEAERREEFQRASDARRAAWAWRRYVSAARSVGDRAILVRYEELTASPQAVAERLGRMLDVDGGELGAALERVHGRSVGRWRRELTPAQLADVEAEAGALLRDLGYEHA